jgi:hypothetical protein
MAEIVRSERIAYWRRDGDGTPPLETALYRRADGSVYGLIREFSGRWCVVVENEPAALLGYLGRLFESDGLAAVERELVGLGMLEQTSAGVTAATRREPASNYLFPVAMAVAGAWLGSR